MKIVAIAIAVAIALPTQASATVCKITSLVAPGLSAAYDPFDATFSPSPVAISIQTQGGNCSGAKLELALIPTPTSPNTGAEVQLVKAGHALLARVLLAGQPRPIVNPTSAFTNNPMFLTVGGAGAIAGDASLALSLGPGQVGAPGGYAATVQLVGRLSDSRGNQSIAQTQVNLSVTVPPSVRLAAGSGQLSIDLGEIKPGDVGGPVTFDAYANVDYSLILRSENGFVMRPGGSGSAPGVPYTPTLSNGTITAAAASDAGTTRQALFNAPGDGMRHHKLRVKVDPFTNLGAGQYWDVMTLEIRARV